MHKKLLSLAMLLSLGAVGSAYCMEGGESSTAPEASASTTSAPVPAPKVDAPAPAPVPAEAVDAPKADSTPAPADSTPASATWTSQMCSWMKTLVDPAGHGLKWTGWQLWSGRAVEVCGLVYVANKLRWTDKLAGLVGLSSSSDEEDDLEPTV